MCLILADSKKHRRNCPGNGAFFFGLKNISAFLLIVAAYAGHLSCSREQNMVQSKTISIPTRDYGNLTGQVVFPKHTSAPLPPGALLLSDTGRDSSVWFSFADRLSREGIIALSLELPILDKSTQSGDATHPQTRIIQEKKQQLHGEVDAALSYLVHLGADPSTLVVVGEGFGATLVLHAALRNPAIQAVVLLSPGLRIRGIGTEEEIRQLKDCPVMIMASEGDTYAAMSASTLKSAAPVYAELRTWPGTAYGADIFEVHSTATAFVLHWLKKIVNMP